MTYYLLVYDRSQGRLLREQPFTSRQDAMSARFAEEAARPVDDDVEVVVLGAKYPSELRRTHGRYFQTPRQLAARTH